MGEKLKSKSSSSIWESMQVQLQDKDKLIEQLKKDLNFYQRQSVINNITQVNNTTQTNIEKKEDNLIEVSDNEIIIEKKDKKVKKDKKDKKDKKSKGKIIHNTEDIDDVDDLEKELLG